MSLKQGLFTVGVLAAIAQSGLASALENSIVAQEEVKITQENSENALGEFEQFAEMMGAMGIFLEQQQQSVVLTHKIQQRDIDCRLSEGAPGCAEEIFQHTDMANYLKAVEDPYYGYQVFIVVDKSKSNGRTIQRSGNQRQPQTMYVYRRNGDQVELILTAPVSTGRELTPGQHDTREGYMRVQSAQRGYRSVKYGEAMPFSLWFESEYGTAIHQTRTNWCRDHIGTRASAGCIRLCADVAPGVFDLVTSYGST
ncbi:MAG: L,D-transpeptidase, partial [Pseudobdellovibrionaceae bacterium]